MHTFYRFSPGIDNRSIARLKKELTRLRTQYWAKSSCEATIESRPPGSFRIWVKVTSQKKSYEAARMSTDIEASIDDVLAELRRQLEPQGQFPESGNEQRVEL